ncbi:hypothetical protein [Pontibacter harenae]|uniref:hypothetical protein n=1 Tax=Pontibacter harenae TaxID=2894083 RepID=UPI001E2C13A0|nr:hypothetical protein [Pontibacter harenae]MCC9166827.1 hypothetical protein [Pontibacter harenae]
MKLRSVICSVAALVLFAACDDLFDDGLTPDGSVPNLTLKAPVANQNITKAQGVSIDVIVTDKDAVKELNFLIKKDNAVTPLVSFKKTPDKNIVEFDTLVSVNAFESGTYKLEVNATDGRTNLATKEVSFRVQ